MTLQIGPPTATLGRLMVDSERRARITQNLQGVPVMELWHSAVRALQTKAPSLPPRLFTLSSDDRPFGAADFMERFACEPHEKAVSALNLANAAIQSAILLWRVVGTAKENPVDKVQDAIRGDLVVAASEKAILLPDIEGLDR